MQTEIGSVYFDAGLAHSRVERIGCDGVRRLRCTLEIDFAIARKMRICAGVPLRQKRESGLACREAYFLGVKILGLPEWNERINRAGIGGKVAAAVDRGKINPAARRKCNALETNLAGRTGIKDGWWDLVGASRRNGGQSSTRLGFLLALRIEALLKLFQLRFEQTDLGRSIIVSSRCCLAR